MARAPRAGKRSAAQIEAGQDFAAAGRAASAKARARRGGKPTKAQHQAALKWAAAGRASQLRKRQGKSPVARKARAAVMPAELQPAWAWPWLEGCNDVAPTCAAAAVANHLLASLGWMMLPDDIMRLHTMAGGDDGAAISDVLEVLAGNRSKFCGGAVILQSFTRTDEDIIVAGLVVGLDTPHGSHAVLSHPHGMVSWGQVLPWTGEPEEAWALEWTR